MHRLLHIVDRTQLKTYINYGDHAFINFKLVLCDNADVAHNWLRLMGQETLVIYELDGVYHMNCKNLGYMTGDKASAKSLVKEHLSN